MAGGVAVLFEKSSAGATGIFRAIDTAGTHYSTTYIHYFSSEIHSLHDMKDIELMKYETLNAFYWLSLDACASFVQ